MIDAATGASVADARRRRTSPQHPAAARVPRPADRPGSRHSAAISVGASWMAKPSCLSPPKNSSWYDLGTEKSKTLVPAPATTDAALRRERRNRRRENLSRRPLGQFRTRARSVGRECGRRRAAAADAGGHRGASQRRARLGLSRRTRPAHRLLVVARLRADRLPPAR